MAIFANFLPINAIVVSSSPTQKLKRSSSSHGSSHLRSLLKSGKLDEAVHLVESEGGSIDVDVDTYSLLFHTCISKRSLQHGRRLHMELLSARGSDRCNLIDNPNLKAKLVTLYSVCGRLDEAQRVFDEALAANLVSKSMWVAMLIACSRYDCSKEVLYLYSKMQYQLVPPCNFAFSSVLKACSNLLDSKFGRAVHAQIVKCEEESDQTVNNALLRFYAACGTPKEELRLFERMSQRDIVSWNSLLGGFVKWDNCFGALDTFRRMQCEGVSFTWITLTTILPVCARLTALQSGKEIHAQIIKSRKQPDIPLLNSLMDMYAKCGVVSYCWELFNGMLNKDLTSWNTILMGYAINGFANKALELFEKMVNIGLKPNDVTFICLLSGCSHAGFTNEGQYLFKRMEEEFGISPSLDHYACLIDLFGRAGKINKAFDVMSNMAMSPSGSILGSLLNSCRLHGNVALGELVAKQLFEIEPRNPGNYIMLSNIYAKAGRWDAVREVREMMEEKGIKKEAGCSWVQIKNKVHTFVAGGGTKFRSSMEYNILSNELMKAMKEFGYVPDTDDVLHNVDEEMKISWVCGHSERLAAMYSLIHTGPTTPIRITKNLRVCIDCHTWMKFVSRVMSRVIVLRDTNRFHHFEEGTCSCKDYW